MDKREKRRDDEAPMTDEEIDANLEGTFPASDPPSWTATVGTGLSSRTSRP